MEIIIHRGKIATLESLSPYSIALDGFVQGPQIDEENHRYSWDHHFGCLRYCTISACMQAWTAVMLGFKDLDKYTIYVNDVDGDVCMAIWCLQNPERCSEPLVKKLVDAIGIADMHAGAIISNGMDKIIEWVLAPETESKKNQDYQKISNDGLETILEAILHRINLYVDGNASIEVAKIHKHDKFSIIESDDDFVIAESKDPHALGALYHVGYNKIVLIRYQDDSSLAVTIAKRSDFVDHFSIKKICDALNEIEPEWNGKKELWGGGSTIHGAPRHSDGSRSHLTLEKISSIIKENI